MPIITYHPDNATDINFSTYNAALMYELLCVNEGIWLESYKKKALAEYLDSVINFSVKAKGKEIIDEPF